MAVCVERFGGGVGGVCMTSGQGASVVNSSAFSEVVFAGRAWEFHVQMNVMELVC